ncbi:hypothetical protein PVMG_05148 [Plasmodium vivax Mauritania I]|uniref:Uncharacterized protein n=1 Tax=Plasmodium vivax Mauritania I TaxID=1035515 RepID=A0A0J9THV2_PLAVI|nr:hypothetical protein PVMG_05148 [Plasmodium vivax Mauritania I]
MNKSKKYTFYMIIKNMKKKIVLTLSFTNQLNSVNFYKKLDNINNFSEYKEYCKELRSVRYGIRAINTCAKLLKYLETDSFSKSNDNQYDYCLLLNYWVFSSLNMNLYLKPFSYISSAFGKIVLIWNDFIEKKLKHRKNETCEPIHSIIMDNDWRDRKELYEYYVNYDALSDTVKIFTNMCEEFFQYVESKKKLYEHFKEPCLSKDTNMCPKFYDECKKYDPENVLSNHSCHEYIMKERAAAAPSVLQRVNTPSDSDPNSDDRDGRMMTYDAPKLSGNPHTVTKLGNVLLGVVATSMTSGALYRININSLLQINCISLLISFITSP